ncbi:MAG TPA: AsmA family protein, partial [Usitatibacter sp.]
MNWRRTAAWTTGALLVAAAAGAIAFHTLVDPERLKAIAREAAMQAGSRELAIGEISLSLFPWPAIDARDVALANPRGARSRNLVQAERVRARFALLPLLVGNVSIKSLDLEGVKCALDASPDTRPGGVSRLAPQAEGATRAIAIEGKLLDLEALRIRDAEIVYRPKAGLAVVWRIEDGLAESDAGLRNVRL